MGMDNREKGPWGALYALMHQYLKPRPVSITASGVRVGVGLVGGNVDEALLGQSFLSRFEVLLSPEQMTLRPLK